MNILKNGMIEPIDLDFFIPLYNQLSKQYLNETKVIEEIERSDDRSKIKILNKIGRIWEEYIQYGITKIVESNPTVERFVNESIEHGNIRLDITNLGNVTVLKDKRPIGEFDGLLLYRETIPIIVEIKSVAKSGVSARFNKKIKLFNEIFTSTHKPLLLKIRSTDENDMIGIFSRHANHRKIVVRDSPLMTEMKERIKRNSVDF